MGVVEEKWKKKYTKRRGEIEKKGGAKALRKQAEKMPASVRKGATKRSAVEGELNMGEKSR